jgi:LPXTG-site transpeptidase (sortase) family protein
MTQAKTFRKTLLSLGAGALVLLMAFQLSGLRYYLVYSSDFFNSKLRHVISLINQPEPLEIVDPCRPDLEKMELRLVPERLIIKNVEIDLPIFSVPLENGTWKVNDFVANYAEGTSLIGDSEGNIGIYGHDKPHALARIKKIENGDEIMLVSGDYLARYRAIFESVVIPDQVDIFYPTGKPILTLVTCEGRFSDQRYVTKAELLTVEKINCHENQTQ